MKKRGWIWLLCGLLAVQPAMAAQTDGAVRVGEVVYDVQTVQSSLTASYQIYTASGVTLDTAQKQQLIDSVLERFVGLGVLENQLRKAGQADIDEATRQTLDEQARQAYEEAWQQMAQAIREGAPDATDQQISAFLTQMGYTLDAYRQEAELALKNQRLIALYCGDISVTDQDARAYYEQQYVSVYRERYENHIPLFEQEVLQDGGQTYYIPQGYRRIKHIVMALPEATQTELAAMQQEKTRLDQQVQQAYDELARQAAADGQVDQARQDYQQAQEAAERMQRQIQTLLDAAKDAVKEQTDAIERALEAGESFESQMRLYSYDTAVAPEEDGYLLHADSLLWDEAFLQAALALEKPGDVSRPVATAAGIHIILYAADEPSGPLQLTDEQFALLKQAALTDKQTRRLEELVSQWRWEYEIETHPEWLTLDDE